MKEVKAANLILGLSGQGEKFQIKWHGLKVNLQIRPITVKGMIKISREVAYLKDLDTEEAVFKTQMEHAASLSHICKAIAIATGTRFTRLVARMIAGLELKHVQTLWAIVIGQSDPNSFFFIMVSGKGMNQMKTKKAKEPQEAEKPSSEE